MKRFYTLTLAIAIVFTFIVSGSQLVFAQANTITGGPLAEDMLLEDPEPNGTILEKIAVTRLGLPSGMDPMATTKTTAPSKFPLRWTSLRKAAAAN